MRLFKSKYTWVITTIVLAVGYIVSCTKNDQVLDVPQAINSSTDLVSVKVTTAPTIDGTIDPMWENSPKLQFSTAVPEVTGDIFRGYTGNIIPSVTLRSAYDDNNIYFLAEWMDPSLSLTRQPWYFDPATKTWAQEKGAPVFTTNGSGVATLTRKAFYEDKLAFLWNINNSVSGWNSGTCYKSCHTGLPAADGSSRHYTNFPTERIDMWHWKSVRGGVNGEFQFEDQHQYYNYPNGRKGDDGDDVYKNNVQTLGAVSVPKYVIPGKDNYGWILQSEIDNNTAKTVTAVDANGVLTLSDATTIDPNVGTDYQRVGAGVGPKAIPGLTINKYTGSRADIPCKATYTGSGWILEFQRALKTADSVNDIDFSSLADQYFGFAIFENAQIAHSIKPNLVLKFKK
ncbi:ethylbenzene dehydrogenase-related protein [Terrimonas alba]|uniref:ethylbenzene dehydrogenase-related protein n=1 Tax=Terrimonas alba TaxID=3349636 RepID=UPI0035F37037